MLSRKYRSEMTVKVKKARTRKFNFCRLSGVYMVKKIEVEYAPPRDLDELDDGAFLQILGRCKLECKM
jgi:hypothetical protein